MFKNIRTKCGNCEIDGCLNIEAVEQVEYRWDCALNVETEGT